MPPSEPRAFDNSMYLLLTSGTAATIQTWHMMCLNEMKEIPWRLKKVGIPHAPARQLVGPSLSDNGRAPPTIVHL
jgi:hypothetical protein